MSNASEAALSIDAIAAAAASQATQDEEAAQAPPAKKARLDPVVSVDGIGDEESRGAFMHVIERARRYYSVRSAVKDVLVRFNFKTLQELHTYLSAPPPFGAPDPSLAAKSPAVQLLPSVKPTSSFPLAPPPPAAASSPAPIVLPMPALESPAAASEALPMSHFERNGDVPHSAVAARLDAQRDSMLPMSQSMKLQEVVEQAKKSAEYEIARRRRDGASASGHDDDEDLSDEVTIRRRPSRRAAKAQTNADLIEFERQERRRAAERMEDLRDDEARKYAQEMEAIAKAHPGKSHEMNRADFESLCTELNLLEKRAGCTNKRFRMRLYNILLNIPNTREPLRQEHLRVYFVNGGHVHANIVDPLLHTFQYALRHKLFSAQKSE